MELVDLSVPFLRSRRNAKWQRFGADVIPAWVAEMDFAIAPPIAEALARIEREQDFGYPSYAETDIALAKVFSQRMKERFGWDAAPAQVLCVSDLVQASFASVMAFSDPGETVLLQTPAYPPFRDAILKTGRRLTPHSLRDDGERFVFDVEALAAAIDERSRVMIFCHPHNPTGRVYDRAELEAIAELAIARDLIVVSDEIHADLVYPGRQHIPLAKISAEIAARTVTITSATKSFNMPGLRCGLMHFGSKALQERFEARIPPMLLGHPSINGFDATHAAWTKCQPWLDGLMVHLTANRDHLVSTIRSEWPEARIYCPEATFLSWIDFSALELPPTPFQFFLEKARVGLSAGDTFDAASRDFGRLNFATSRAILDEILGRMIEAVRKR